MSILLRREFFATAAGIFGLALAGISRLTAGTVAPSLARETTLEALARRYEAARAIHAIDDDATDPELARRTDAWADALEALEDGIRGQHAGCLAAVIAGRLYVVRSAYTADDRWREAHPIACIDRRMIAGL